MDVLRTIMGEIECVVSKVEKEEIDRVVNLIRKDRRIFVAGEGRSGFSAKGFAMRLMHLGYTVYVVGETITPALREGDLLVGVSGSGKSISVIDAARKAKEKNGVVIAVTSKKGVPACRICGSSAYNSRNCKRGYRREQRVDSASEFPF